MSRNLPFPFLPVPPPEYDRGYFAELVRAISLYMNQQQNPGEGRNTKLVLTDLQQSDAGLEAGTLFAHDGYVKISLADCPHPQGAAGTSAVGSVTVSTP